MVVAAQLPNNERSMGQLRRYSCPVFPTKNSLTAAPGNLRCVLHCCSKMRRPPSTSNNTMAVYRRSPYQGRRRDSPAFYRPPPDRRAGQATVGFP